MPENKQKPNWLSIGQAAKFIGVSPDTLRRWEKKGKIKAFRSPTNRRYYTKEQLKAAMMGKMLQPKTMSEKSTSTEVKKLSEKSAIMTVKKKTSSQSKIVLRLILIALTTIIITAIIAFSIFFFFL